MRAFRHAVKILKQKGLIQNIDASKAQPWMIRQGRPLKDTVNKFDDVVSGKVEPVKLPSSKIREYQKSGYETTKAGGGRVLVPKLKGDKVSVTKEGEVKITEKSGIQRIKKAVPYHNLIQWLNEMRENRLRIDAMKRRNEYFGYKIFGHTSWNLYRSIDDLLDELINGSISAQGVPIAERFPTTKSGNEFFEHFEIVRVPRAESWPNPPQKKGHGSAKAAKRYRKKIKGTAREFQLQEKNRERQQKWRDSLKGKKLKEYRNDARKRKKRNTKKRRKHGK